MAPSGTNGSSKPPATSMGEVSQWRRLNLFCSLERGLGPRVTLNWHERRSNQRTQSRVALLNTKLDMDQEVRADTFVWTQKCAPTSECGPIGARRAFWDANIPQEIRRIQLPLCFTMKHYAYRWRWRVATPPPLTYKRGHRGAVFADNYFSPNRRSIGR